VLVTTDVLAKRLAHLNPRTTVIPNFLDDRIWFGGKLGRPSSRDKTDPLRIAFIGGGSHGPDLDSIAEAMKSVMDMRPGQIELTMVGADFNPIEQISTCRLSPPPELAGHYVRFVNWLRQTANWHVGIAPLADNPFNLAKSPLKYLDYSALGLASVFPNRKPFSGVVSPNRTGLLVSTIDEWRDAIITFVDDEPLREQLASAARHDVKQNHTIIANKAFLRDLWGGLF